MLSSGHITEHKQTETTQRWKLGLLSGQMQIPTRIEFSRRRGKKKESRFEAVDALILKRYDLPPVLVNHYTAEVAFLQKIRAMSSRNVPQARDVFDLYLLITNGIDADAVLKGVDRAAVKKARDNIFSIDYETFKSQVVSYLDADDREIYGSEEIWDTIRLKVSEVMEG